MRAAAGSPGVSCRRLPPRVSENRAAAAGARNGGARRHFLPLDSSTPCPRLDAINDSERREYPFSDEGFRVRGLDVWPALTKKQQSGSINPETSGDMSWCTAPTSPAVWGAAGGM